MRIGVIGATGGQGKKLIQASNKQYSIDFIVYDHHEEHEIVNQTNYQVTKDLSVLLKCDGIIIASPNFTHIFYLKYFLKRQYKGYIYCEKVPVCSEEDIIFLEQLNNDKKRRILFGFNLQRSVYQDILKGKYELGRLLYCNISEGHGLGFKDVYKDSWRNDAKIKGNGIFSIVCIHYIELFISQFGLPIRENLEDSIMSQGGQTMDNCLYSAQYGDSVMLSIYCSYTCPLIERSLFVFDDGYIEILEDSISIFKPRDCFDSIGNFIKPTRTIFESAGMSDLWIRSLEKNIGLFYKTIEENGDFSLEEYSNALLVNKYILDKDIF